MPMNRETELHFGNVPQVNHPRSIFDESHSVTTTFNTGQIIPIMVDGDITPGDSVTMDISHVIRMATPIFPVMDSMIADIMAFFVPKRLVWDDWKTFWGESDDPYGIETDLEEPQLEAPENGWASGSLADYMGIATYVEHDISALQFRGYCQIWNDWFRDENNKSAVHIYKDDTTRTGNNKGLAPNDGYDYVTDAEGGGAPLKAAKLHDYFTSCLPSPQRGPDVLLPLGQKANVYTGPTHSIDSPNYPTEKYGIEWGGYYVEDGTKADFNTAYTYPNVFMTAEAPIEPTRKAILDQWVNTEGATSGRNSSGIVMAPANLYTDLQNATAATISQLRQAIALQHYYEARSKYGTRYIETLKGLFGVTSSDARLQRSEYLGGIRVPVNMDTIIQTSSTDAVTPQGNTAGYSCTVGKDNLFTKSFEEHGILYVLIVCRHENTYQQGIPKQFLRKKNTDYYNPFFAHLTEQPVKLEQLYATGTDDDSDVFGYQEPFAEMRYKPNIVTGMMRSNTPGGGLDSWHYADDYASRPYLSSEWIDADTTNVDRTLAVQSSLAHQFLANFWIKAIYTREMPVYGTPGLTRI